MEIQALLFRRDLFHFTSIETIKTEAQFHFTEQESTKP